MRVAQRTRPSSEARRLRLASARRTSVVSAEGVEGNPPADVERGWPISEQAVRDILRYLERVDAPDHRRLRSRSGDLQRGRRLRGQLPSVSIVPDPSTAAIGRCVRVGTEVGRERAWWLALPGDESATAETLSITSPIGKALAWASPGDTVYLPGHHGAWAVVLDVVGPR